MMNLLWAIALVFVLMWALGFSMHAGGGLIHLLLVLAVASVLIRIIMGRRVA
jgi:hypothetical protein